MTNISTTCAVVSGSKFVIYSVINSDKTSFDNTAHFTVMHPNALLTGDGLTVTRASYLLLVNKKTSINYSGTPPYGSLGNIVILLLPKLFSAPPSRTAILLAYKKNPLNVVTC